MIDALLAPFYKWLVLALLVVVGGLWWHNSYLGQKIATAQLTMELEIEKAVKPYLDAKKAFEENAHLVSGLYEEIKSNENKKTNVINNKVEKLTERVVYRNVCIDVDGVSVLNEAGTIEYPP